MAHHKLQNPQWYLSEFIRVHRTVELRTTTEYAIQRFTAFQRSNDTFRKHKSNHDFIKQNEILHRLWQS